MTTKRLYTDEELTSYLDGEAAPELQQEIELAAASDRSLAERLRTLSLDTEDIKSAFDELTGTAPEPPAVLLQDDDDASRVQGRFNTYQAASIACLVFAVGILLGRVVSLPNQPNWQDYAAKYHALYVTETLARVPNNSKSLDGSLARAENALQHKFNKKTLSSVPGLDLKRSQILGFEGRPLIQLAYLSKSGAPVALCIIKKSGGTKNPPVVSTMEGLAAASWSKEGYEYLLIGGRDETLIKDAAAAFHKTL